MSFRFVRLLKLTVCVVLSSLLVGLGVDGQTKDGKGKNAGKDLPGTGKYLAQLRSVFATWDTNDDRKVDATELARVYRGPSAKALDPEGDLMKFESFADYHVFKLLDKNKDWTITKMEFDTWAEDHAEDLARQEQALERLAQKMKQLNKADPKSKNYQKLKNDLKQEQNQVDRLQDRIRAMQKQIQQMKRNDNDGGKKNPNRKGK